MKIMRREAKHFFSKAVEQHCGWTKQAIFSVIDERDQPKCACFQRYQPMHTLKKNIRWNKYRTIVQKHEAKHLLTSTMNKNPHFNVFSTSSWYALHSVPINWQWRLLYTLLKISKHLKISYFNNVIMEKRFLYDATGPGFMCVSNKSIAVIEHYNKSRTVNRATHTDKQIFIQTHIGTFENRTNNILH